MNDWERLYRDFAQGERRRLEQQQATIAAWRARRSFELWMHRATSDARCGIQQIARQRAAEVGTQTRCPLQLAFPEHTVPPTHESTYFPFLRASMVDSVVDLYFYCTPVDGPTLDWPRLLALRTRASSGRSMPGLKRHPRPSTHAGFLLVRTATEDWELRRIAAGQALHQRPSSCEDVVFWAFELLARSMVHGPRSAAAALPRPGFPYD